MNSQNHDYQILAALSQTLKMEYSSDDDQWIGSPFAWIKTRPSRQIGAIGEKLIAGWLATRGFNVNRSGNTDADRIIENKRIEIKFSTLWKSGGYTFQQIRDQNYDLLICLGVSPFDAHCWVIPKADVMRLWIVEGKITGQHTGASGSDTAWLSFQIQSPPEWLSVYGGALSDAVAILSDETGFKPQEFDEERESQSIGG